MKKVTAPIPYAGSQLDQRRHVSAFFTSADEEYRVLLPWVPAKWIARIGKRKPTRKVLIQVEAGPLLIK